MHAIKESWYKGLNRQQHMGGISNNLLCDACTQVPYKRNKKIYKLAVNYTTEVVGSESIHFGNVLVQSIHPDRGSLLTIGNV